MRICFSGTASTGKSTLLNAFLRKWPMYGTPMKTYRDVLKENNLPHSSSTTEDTQLTILDWMMNEHKKYNKDSLMVFDRCPWDNLAYTLQGNLNETISDEVTAATISFVRESMKDIDIIFWLKHDPDIKIIEDGVRDTNKDFIIQTDSIFQDLFNHYSENLEADIFYPKEDCPAIIPLDGKTVDDRLFFISQFLTKEGTLIDDEPSMFDPSNLDLLEKMVTEQKDNKQKDNQIKKIAKEFTL
jgi:hypothetical protein